MYAYIRVILRERVGAWENSPAPPLRNDYNAAAKCLSDRAKRVKNWPQITRERSSNANAVQTLLIVTMYVYFNTIRSLTLIL